MKKAKTPLYKKDGSMVRKTYVTEVVSDDEAKKLFDACTKTFDCQVKGNKDVDEARTMVLKISTLDPDRSKDRVFPKGFILDDFLNNPVVAAFHDYHKPAVGRALKMGIADDYVVSKMEFPPEGINPEADILHGLYDKGFQHAASIGFIPEEMEPNDLGGYDFQKTNLLEYSLVLVPDNPNALRMMYEKGFNPDTYKEDFLEPLEEEKQTKKAKEETPEETKLVEITVKIGDTEEVIKTLDEGKAVIDRLAAENEELKKAAQAHKEANDLSTDAPIGGLSIGQLKDLLADGIKGVIGDKSVDNEAKSVVTKDVEEVLALGDVLSCLSWVIWAFGQDWDDDGETVSQSSIDKLNQALGLILQVVQEQAVLGKKEFKLSDIPTGKEFTKIVAKAGRTISSKHEEMLSDAQDHMKQASDTIQNVLNTATPTETNDGVDDAGKSVADDELYLVIAEPVTKAIEETVETEEDEDDMYGMYPLRGGEKN